jgi:hypothetical protein
MLSIKAVGYNDDGSELKLRKFLEIARRHNPVNLGSTTANMFQKPVDEVLAGAGKVSHAVFSNTDDLVAMMKDLKEADLGMSVVVSGLVDVVDECCRKAGIQRHTVEFSLGIWGKTELLPPDDVLEVTTMCGHAMISPKFVQSVVEDVRAGKMTAEAAGKTLAPQCTCGIFNPVRAGQLVGGMAAKKE